MSTVQNDIRDIFSIFHDGGIVDCKGDLNKLTLTIQCNYLAEIINPEFENFYFDLIEVNKLDFIPWMNPIDMKKIKFNNHEEYLKVDLEILSAEIKDNNILITCNQHDTDLDYCGGNLIISANNFKLFDHNRTQMTIEQLDLICRTYWDNSKIQSDKMNKNFKLKADQIQRLIPNLGACIATDKITVDGLKVGYMYREESDEKTDSGWRFFSGTETQDYVDNSDNSAVYDLNTIANYDNAIIPYLELPIGSELERISETDRFEETNE